MKARVMFIQSGLNAVSGSRTSRDVGGFDGCCGVAPIVACVGERSSDLRAIELTAIGWHASRGRLGLGSDAPRAPRSTRWLSTSLDRRTSPAGSPAIDGNSWATPLPRIP